MIIFELQLEMLARLNFQSSKVQRHKAIFNNHACPQSYNNFLYNVRKIIWFSIYRHCDFVKKKNIYSHVDSLNPKGAGALG